MLEQFEHKIISEEAIINTIGEKGTEDSTAKIFLTNWFISEEKEVEKSLDYKNAQAQLTFKTAGMLLKSLPKAREKNPAGIPNILKRSLDLLENAAIQAFQQEGVSDLYNEIVDEENEVKEKLLAMESSQ